MKSRSFHQYWIVKCKTMIANAMKPLTNRELLNRKSNTPRNTCFCQEFAFKYVIMARKSKNVINEPSISTCKVAISAWKLNVNVPTVNNAAFSPYSFLAKKYNNQNIAMPNKNGISLIDQLLTPKTSADAL